MYIGESQQSGGSYSTAGIQSSARPPPNQQAPSLPPETAWSPLRQRSQQPSGPCEVQQNFHAQPAQPQPLQPQQPIASQQQMQAQQVQQTHPQGAWQQYLQQQQFQVSSASSWSFKFQPEALTATGFTQAPAPGWQRPTQLKWNIESLKALRNRSIFSETLPDPLSLHSVPVTYQVVDDGEPNIHNNREGQGAPHGRNTRPRNVDVLSPNHPANAGGSASSGARSFPKSDPAATAAARGSTPLEGRNMQRPVTRERSSSDGNINMSVSGFTSQIESTWEAIRNSLERAWTETVSAQSFQVFASCTKVPGQPSARFVQGAPSDFTLGCEHIEPCLARAASRDDMFLPSRDQPRPPTRPLPRSWSARTSPPLRVEGQSGGVPSSLTGFRNSEPQGIDATVDENQEYPCQCPMSASEVRDALAASGTSMCSLKGNKQTAPNQDRASCAAFQHRAAELLTVFDGHGEFGHLAAERSEEILPKLLLQALAKAAPAGLVGPGGSPSKQLDSQNPQDAAEAVVEWPEAACQAFTETHDIFEALTLEAMGGSGATKADNSYALDARASGTTATVVLLLASRKALIAHVGDSRAVLGTRPRGNPRARWRAVNLTRDHKPELPDEQARIDKAGAQIISSGQHPNAVSRIFTPQQHWPMINMTRSIGDLHAHSQGLTADAEVQVVERLWDPNSEEAVLIICSDGVWDVMDSLAVVEFVTEPHAVGMEPAMALAHEAHVRWARRGLANGYVDDITALVKFL